MTLSSTASTAGPPRRELALPLRRGLYAIVDVASVSARGLDPIAFSRAVLEARPSALQLRAKALESREMLALLRAIGSSCREAGVPFVTNDRVDLAVLAGAPFVHVGQGDMSVESVRRVAPGLRVGVSTHTPEQLAAAIACRPDYVAYGPVFPTRSKANPDPCVGVEGLAAAARLARAAEIPLVGIGGITETNAAELRALLTAGAAIHALLPRSSGAPYPEVTARARALHAALGGDADASSSDVA